METRIRIASPFGTSFQTVPHFLSAQPVWPFRDKSTLSIHYPEMGVKSELLNGECEVIFEYYNGSSWVEPKDSRFMTGGGSHDRLEQTPTKRYDFAALLPAMLERAHVWEAAGLPTDTDGNILFGAATPGTIMRTLFNNAKARGWGTALSLDFTATHDSNGQAWAGGINLALDPAQTLYDVISALGNQGIVDWCGQGRTLQMFNPDTALGRDLPNVRLFAAHGETSAPEQISHRDRATVLRVVGDEGLKWDRANGTSPWGRLEAIMSAGGVSDEGTAYLMSDEELLKASGARISRTREFDGSSNFLPHRDFRGGDHVRYQTENGLESMRVFSMSLTIEERTTGYAVLGDRFEDALIRAARNQQKLTVGKINGGNGKQPTQPSDDVRTPEHPFGFVMSSSAYLDPIGEEVGRVHAGWSHTGKATDGTEIDIDRFEFRIRESGLGDDQWQSFRSVHGDDRNAVFSPVRVRREDGSQEVYDFAIRAVSAASRVSRWIYYRNLIMEPDMVPPPVPSMPIGEAVYGVIIIQWDGLGEGDEPMPPDFIHTEAEIGTSPEGPWQFVNNYERAGAVPVPFKLPYGTYWMRLRSVDRVGNKSEWSALGEVTSTPLVDLPDVHDMIDDINTQIEGVRESANGANRRIDSTEDPSVDGKERDGDSWWKWTVAPHVADPKILLGQWTWMVNKWEPMEMGHQVLASIDLGKATVGMLDGIFIKAKTLNAGHIIVGDFTNLATLDPDRGINVTQPAGFLTEIVGDYAKKAAGGSDSLMFMDQTGPVPIESEDWVRISFVATASSSVGVTARVSVYPNVMGSTGVVSGSTPVSIEVGTNTYSVDVQIPSLDAISGGKSWIAGLVGSGIRSLQVRNVRVYKKSNATLIGPDSIRTPHLGADIIEGHHIKANTIETDNLVGGFADFIVMTGSLVQTVAQANRGIKLSGDSNNMQGWNSSGQRTLLIDANTGNVFLGRNEMVRIYGASGNVDIGLGKLTIDGSTGDLTLLNSTVTAGVVQTTATASRGIRMDSVGLRGWNSDGDQTFLLNASNGFASMAGRLITGVSSAVPRWAVVPWEEDSANNRLGLWAIPPGSSGIGGSNTGGFYVEDPNTSVGMRSMHIRGLNGGGVKFHGDKHFFYGVLAPGIIENESGGYKIQPANGSFFNGSVDFKGRIFNTGIPETTQTANVFVAPDGTFWMSSSASRFKIDKKPLNADDALLDVPVMSWIDKGQVEERERLSKIGVRSEHDQTAFDLYEEPSRVSGVIAEDVEATPNGELFVTRNADGNLQGVAYDRLAIAQISVLKRKNDALETRLARLEKLLTT